MFGLVSEWIDEVTGELFEQWIDWYDTKEELFEKKAKVEDVFCDHIAMGRLIVYPVVRYDWDELNNYF